MTPQQSERVESIRARRARAGENVHDDEGFLLSLLDSPANEVEQALKELQSVWDSITDGPSTRQWKPRELGTRSSNRNE